MKRGGGPAVFLPHSWDCREHQLTYQHIQHMLDLRNIDTKSLSNYSSLLSSSAKRQLHFHSFLFICHFKVHIEIKLFPGFHMLPSSSVCRFNVILGPSFQHSFPVWFPHTHLTVWWCHFVQDSFGHCCYHDSHLIVHNFFFWTNFI